LTGCHYESLAKCNYPEDRIETTQARDVVFIRSVSKWPLRACAQHKQAPFNRLTLGPGTFPRFSGALSPKFKKHGFKLDLKYRVAQKMAHFVRRDFVKSSSSSSFISRD